MQSTPLPKLQVRACHKGIANTLSFIETFLKRNRPKNSTINQSIMKLSDAALGYLNTAITGDSNYNPALTGREVFLFFKNYGFSQAPEIISRRFYASQKLKELNGSETLIKLIEDLVSPKRNFVLNMLGVPITIDAAVVKLNSFLQHEGFALKKIFGCHRLTDGYGYLINMQTWERLDKEYVNQEIQLCLQNLEQENYSVAVNICISLLKEILIQIIVEHDQLVLSPEGNLRRLWPRIKKIFEDEKDMFQTIEILSGIENLITTIDRLNSSDFKFNKPTAQLALNLSLSVIDFLMSNETRTSISLNHKI